VRHLLCHLDELVLAWLPKVLGEARLGLLGTLVVFFIIVHFDVLGHVALEHSAGECFSGH